VPVPPQPAPSRSAAPKPVTVLPPPAPKPPVKATPGPSRTPAPPAPAPPPAPTPQAPAPSPSPTSPPTTPPPTTPPPPPPPAPVPYKLNSLPVGRYGDNATAPTIRAGLGSWWWDRWGLSIGGKTFAHGITVRGLSMVTIDLNRACLAFDASAGVDDLTRGPGAPLRFSVYGDGSRLWSSPAVRGGAPAVPVHVGLRGVTTLKLVVRPEGLGLALADLADWADSQITCS
jgi:hypothetical protein